MLVFVQAWTFFALANSRQLWQNRIHFMFLIIPHHAFSNTTSRKGRPPFGNHGFTGRPAAGCLHSCERCDCIFATWNRTTTIIHRQRPLHRWNIQAQGDMATKQTVNIHRGVDALFDHWRDATCHSPSITHSRTAQQRTRAIALTYISND